METCLLLRSSGRVQGVGYRFFVIQAAKEHHIQGWVKNETDGTVCTCAQGETNNLQAFIETMYARNNPYIRVDRIDVSDSTPITDKGFFIRHD